MKMEIKKVPRLSETVGGDSFCVDDCISTYAYYRGLDYEPAYLGALRAPFEIVNDDLILKEEIFLNINENCGIYIENLEWKNSAEMIERIKMEVSNGSVIAIDLAGYYCPWDWRYQEIDMEGSNHEFFVVGINDKEEFLCVDPYYEENNVSLPYVCCINGCVGAKVFKDEKIYLDDIELIRRIDLEKEKWEETFQDFERLGDNIGKYMEESIRNLNKDEDLETTYYAVNNNIIYCIMENIANNRMRFVWFLKYLEKRCIIQSSEFAEEFMDISKMWNSIKRMIVKNLYRGQYDVESFKEKITELCTYEKNVLNKLLFAIHNKNIQKDLRIFKRTSSREEQYIIYSIRDYYNNKGISDDSSQKADFNGFGECFDLSTFPLEQTLYYYKIPFLIQSSKNGGDNIVCRKQNLKVSPQKYSKVCFLACSDWGECKDFFQLQYVDETIENKVLDISEWVPDKNVIQRNVCFTARKTLKTLEYEFEQCHVYYYELECNYDKELSLIRLPNCENIHIFAVTLVNV